MKLYTKILCFMAASILSLNILARPTVELPTAISPTDNSSTLTFDDVVQDLRSQAAKDSIRGIFNSPGLSFTPEDYDSVHRLATYNVRTAMWRLKGAGATAQDGWVKRLMMYLYWYNHYVSNTLFMGRDQLESVDKAMQFYSEMRGFGFRLHLSRHTMGKQYCA